MKKYKTPIYTYYEALPKRSLNAIPEVLSFDQNLSQEAVFFRLLLGTINIEYNINGYTLKPRANYAHLGVKSVKNLCSKSIADCEVPSLEYKDAFNKYMKLNRKNTKIFECLLNEFSGFFYQKSRGAHISAFVHLYRCIEYMSYSFPLVYASKSIDYKGTYSSLKDFMSGTKTELKFFRDFQRVLIAPEILKLQLNIDITAPTTDMKEEFNKLIINIASGTGILTEPNGTGMSISYNDLWDFSINLRNRYFHLLVGDGQKNIDSTKVCMDYFFETFNEHVANWIAFTYFEITKFGVEQYS